MSAPATITGARPACTHGRAARSAVVIPARSATSRSTDSSDSARRWITSAS